MHTPTPPPQLLTDEERISLLHSFEAYKVDFYCNQFVSSHNKWYGRKKDGLPRRIIEEKSFWPKADEILLNRYPDYLKLLLNHEWPQMPGDAMDLTLSVLGAENDIQIADHLVKFWLEHRNVISLILIRFFAKNIRYDDPIKWSSIDAISINADDDNQLFESLLDSELQKIAAHDACNKQFHVPEEFLEFYFEDLLKAYFSAAKKCIASQSDDGGTKNDSDSDDRAAMLKKPDERPQP